MKYRVIAASGYGDGDGKSRIEGYFATAAEAVHQVYKSGGALIAQESLEGEFDTDRTWDWADWAHRTGYLSGLIRHLKVDLNKGKRKTK